MHDATAMALLREPNLLGVTARIQAQPQPRTQAQPRTEAHPRTRRYKIVVGIDLSEYADIVLEHALDQAARHDAPELHFLTVCEKRRAAIEDCKQALWERVYPALETFNQYGSDWKAKIHARRGRPEVEIASLAADLRADLIVIGQFGLHHKTGDKNLPNRILQQAVCPTLVVGLPNQIDAEPQCPMCAAVREDSDGDQWFCAKHAGDRGVDHVMTPMTTWSGGTVMW